MNNTTLAAHPEYRALLLSGHALADFSVSTDSIGLVRVRGPGGAATYMPEEWLAQFGRHLLRGLFDELALEADRTLVLGPT